jgi:hypothetical protein
MNNTVTRDKLKDYNSITAKALAVAKNSIEKGKEKEAKEIISMVENYLSDAEFFEKKGDWVNAFAAINYAHGWIDCGVRLGVFDIKDDTLFTIR